jgi:hypothetical protein
MLGLKHKASVEKPAGVHFVVYRSRRCDGSMSLSADPCTEAQALEAFKQCVAKGYITPTNGRRLIVTGPDYTVLPDNPDDPLLIGDTAVKAVLSEQEYRAYLGQYVAAALEG